MMSDIALYDPKIADAGFDLRSALLRAAYGPETPPSDIHLRIITWSRASAPNTLKAVASDLKIVEAYQSSRYRPTLPLRPIDLYMLIEDRAQQGISKRSEEHTSELQSLMRISYAVFCLKKKNSNTNIPC